MLLGIDHLVIAVRSVEAAAEILERDLGLAVTGGGRHEAMGTHNRLAFLGDTYVELIGVFDAALVRSSTSFAVGNAALAHLETRGEGLATYALATDDVARDVERLRAAGSPIDEPVAGSRVRPDGEVVRWVCAFPELGPDRPPFLIEHEPAGAEWGEEARAARAAFRHPGGGRVRLTALRAAGGRHGSGSPTSTAPCWACGSTRPGARTSVRSRSCCCREAGRPSWSWPGNRHAAPGPRPIRGALASRAVIGIAAGDRASGTAPGRMRR